MPPVRLAIAGVSSGVYGRRMAQNIYDDPDFFRGYSGLPRSAEGLSAAAEWPWMQALLPPHL